MLTQWLQQQLDYIFFCYGFGFIFLAAVCASLRQNQTKQLPWFWLGLFGLTHALNEWLDLFALSIGSGPVLSSVRLGVLVLSFAFLIEFARHGWMKLHGNGPGRWIYLPLLVLAFLGLPAGLSGLNATARYSFGFTGGLWAALTLRAGSKKTETGRLALSLAAIFMLGYAVAAGLIVPKAAFMPASMIHDTAFVHWTGLPIQLIRGLLTVLFALAIWEFYRKSARQISWDPAQSTKPFYRFLLPLLILAVLLGGSLLTRYFDREADRATRNDMLRQTQIMAAALNPEHIRPLTGSIADLNLSDYVRLRRQFLEIRQTDPQLRRLYLMIRKENKILFIVDSVPQGEFGHTDPGVIYERPPQAVFELFIIGRSTTLGPDTDEYGPFLSAYSIVRDPLNRRILAVLGADRDATVWQKTIMRYRLLSIGITLLVTLLLVALFVARQRTWESTQKIAAGEETLTKSQEIAHFGSWELDLINNALTWSKELYRILEIDPETPVASILLFLDLVHPEDRDAVNQAYRHSVKNKSSYDIEHRLKFPDDRIKFVHGYGETLFDQAGNPLRFLGALQDITERKQVEEALRESEERFRNIFEGSNDAMMLLTEQGYFDCNPRTLEMFAFNNKEEFIRSHPSDLSPPIQPDDRPSFSAAREHIRTAYEQGQDRFEWTQRRANGEDFPADVLLSAFTMAGKRVLQATVRDITERKRAEEKLLELALVDEWTGLNNRRGFLMLAAQQMKSANRFKQGLTLIYADLDGLKRINDNLGHKEGDRALLDTANILRSSFRASDIIARLGGDEFVGLSIETGPNSGEIILNRLQEQLTVLNLQEPRPYKLSISFGTARYNPGNPCSLDQLLEYGDKAMYEQKKTKKNGGTV